VPSKYGTIDVVVSASECLKTTVHISGMNINGIQDWGDFKAYSTCEMGSGSLLVATPFQNDPYFRRSVILLVEHGIEGSLGFLLNKRIDMKLYQIIKDLDETSMNLFLGGPVQMDTLHFVHRLGAEFAGECTEISPGIYWGGDFELVKQNIQAGLISTQDINFYMGYAGWNHEQLENEFEDNSWISIPASLDDLFTDQPDLLWNQVLHTHEPRLKMLSHFPVNPRYN